MLLPTRPAGFDQLVSRENGSARGKLNGGSMISVQPNERALLTALLGRLQVGAPCTWRSVVLAVQRYMMHCVDGSWTS